MEMSTEEAAQAAIRSLNDRDYEGRTLSVAISEAPARREGRSNYR